MKKNQVKLKSYRSYLRKNKKISIEKLSKNYHKRPPTLYIKYYDDSKNDKLIRTSKIIQEYSEKWFEQEINRINKTISIGIK